MRIATGTLFFALAVFLDYIELISSVRMTLGELFPGNNYIDFPPIRTLDKKLLPQYKNFRILDYRQMPDPSKKTFLTRGKFIFGWKHGEDIKQLSILFDGYDTSVVFDSENDRWVRLKKEEMEKLGANRVLRLVRAIDQVAAELNKEFNNRHYVDHKGSEQIHIAASQEAYIAAEKQEEIQMVLLRKGRGIYSGCAYMIQKTYRETYAEAYRHYYYLTKF